MCYVRPLLSKCMRFDFSPAHASSSQSNSIPVVFHFLITHLYLLPPSYIHWIVTSLLSLLHTNPILENRWHDSVLDFEIGINGYNLFWRVRSSTWGGSVCISCPVTFDSFTPVNRLWIALLSDEHENMSSSRVYDDSLCSTFLNSSHGNVAINIVRGEFLASSMWSYSFRPNLRNARCLWLSVVYGLSNKKTIHSRSLAWIFMLCRMLAHIYSRAHDDTFSHFKFTPSIHIITNSP